MSCIAKTEYIIFIKWLFLCWRQNWCV